MEFGDAVKAGAELHREACDRIDAAWARRPDRN
jgi:hypothetical protein